MAAAAAAVRGVAAAAGIGQERSADFVDIKEKMSDYLIQRGVCTRSGLSKGHLDLSGLVIVHNRTQYEHEPDRVSMSGTREEDGVSEAQTLFRTELENSTDNIQTITLHTEREVAATYSVTMQRSFNIEGSLNLTISPPKSSVKAAIGAKASLNLTGGRQSSDSEKTRWSLDTPVVVKPQNRMEVTIHLIEEELKSEFTVQTTISGRVVFRPMDKSGRPHQKKSPVPIDDIREVLLPRDGFERVDTDFAVTFRSEGNIYCRYGVNQKVTFNERHIQAQE